MIFKLVWLTHRGQSIEQHKLRQIENWIKTNFEPSTTQLVDRKGYKTSYGQKHTLQEDTGIYLYSWSFELAMLTAGFEPIDPSEPFWRFRGNCVPESIPV